MVDCGGVAASITRRPWDLVISLAYICVVVTAFLIVSRAQQRQPRSVFVMRAILALLSLLSISLLHPLPAKFAFGLLQPQNEADFNSPQLFTNNGLTDVVQWDNYSLVVRDQRIFLYSGEFHAFRLPVPDLWLDIFQKVKAAGLNAVSIYLHWGLSNPSPNVIDFEDWRALQPVFDSAKLAGLFIVLRPGPYINAETTAGGIAHWATSQVAGELRTNSSDFRAAWEPYIQAVIKAVVPNQVTNDGPIIAVQIDNEYSQNPSPRAEYFVQLESAYRDGGVVVPLTYNDPGQGSNFINGTGAVDLYGLDSYPQGFDCAAPSNWNPVTLNYHQYHETVNPAEPWYFPEFQGGSFDAWGPTAPGYDDCFTLTGPDFQQVFYLQLWASNAKLISFYMIFGGTSWGAIPFHGVYTSYDYGSTIRENRELTTKFLELKNQGLFLRSSPDFRKTDWIGDSSTGAVSVSNASSFVTFLRNPDSGAGFYIARQSNSTSTEKVTFKITVDSASGTLHIPQTVDGITLDGRQSRVIVTNYTFGQQSKMLYSTASIFFAGNIGGRDTLFLYGPTSQSHESAIVLNGLGGMRTQSSNVLFSKIPESDATILSFLPGIEGLVVVWESSNQLILYGDPDTTGTFFAPVIPPASGASQIKSSPESLGSYWQFGSNSTMLVGGPYLVRNATMEGSKLSLQGDLKDSVTLTIIAPTVTSVVWNGNPLRISPLQGVGKSSVLVASLASSLSSRSVSVPSLQSWKFRDNLPEIQANFSDAAWVVANHNSTNIPFKPYYGDGRVLYGCDYGFCENTVLYRGHFNVTGLEKSVNLSINGGEAFAASVWINDQFIKTGYGNSTNNANILEEIDDVFEFPVGSLRAGHDNVITIIHDNMGLNETQGSANTSKSPRGVRGFRLNNGTFGQWKVQGKLGGYTNYPDKVRGIFNEGGTFGERSGWHLPGFDTSSWETRSLSSGLPSDAAGIGFFVTTFDLHIDDDLDVGMSFVFDNGTMGSAYRAYLFVNGWNMGKRVANLGPQSKFPVHEGILNYKGTNTVAVVLWAMEANTSIRPTLDLVVDTIVEGGVGLIATNNPPWERRRLTN